MSNKYMKRYSVSLAIRRMQNKTLMKYCYMLTRLANLKKKIRPTRSEAEEQEVFYPLQEQKLLQARWKAPCHYLKIEQSTHSPSKSTSRCSSVRGRTYK